MSEKRFRANFDVSIYDSETEEYISASENGLKEIAKRMNEQQSTITALKEENEQLRKELKEKQEDEKEYARKILRLNKLVKEYSEIRQLGGDY